MRNRWRKQHTIRRYLPQTIVEGYAVGGKYEDLTVYMDVQPIDNRQTLEQSGYRRTKRLSGHTDELIQTADQKTGRKADRLYYENEWYECVSCNRHINTPLGHYKSEWVLCAEAHNGEDYDVPYVPPNNSGGDANE